MTESDSAVAERIRARVESELPLLDYHLRGWILAHRVTPREIWASTDAEGTQRVRVWLVTDHIGADDSSSGIVYEAATDTFGIVIDLQKGISWFQGGDGSLLAALENM
jgi:hypothetical protein